MNRFNPSIRVILLAVLIIYASTLFIFKFRVRTERQATVNRALEESPRRRYSTSDEMRYIMYGIGDQFSPDDQLILDYIRCHISEPSLSRPRQLKRSDGNDASEYGQSTFVDKLLSGRRGGFFVECGAADGEYSSNSLFFELQRNWTGLLIEASPNLHRELLDKNRRAYVLSACLSIERRPARYRLRWRRDGAISSIVDLKRQTHLPFVGNNSDSDLEVNCFPLNSVMAALGVSHVDYLSLDVEGAELQILRTVDWTRLRIDVITVEYRIIASKQPIDIPATLKKLNDTRRFFRDTGSYHEVGLLPSGDEALGLDVVFSRV